MRASPTTGMAVVNVGLPSVPPTLTCYAWLCVIGPGSRRLSRQGSDHDSPKLSLKVLLMNSFSRHQLPIASLVSVTLTDCMGNTSLATFPQVPAHNARPSRDGSKRRRCVGQFGAPIALLVTFGGVK